MKRILFLFFGMSVTLTTYSQDVDSLVDPFSLGSVYITAQKGKNRLWNGTGFFLKVKSTVYLITNNHVVGGKYYLDELKRDSKKDVSNAEIPDIIRIRLFDKGLGSEKTELIGLKDSGGKFLYKKIYENDNDTNSLLDVVAIPLIGQNEIGKRARMDYYDSSVIGEISLYPSQELFVVGYPQNTSNFYPIWKRGNIASEPNFITVGRSVFYIDATTRKGMSGSPVLFRGTERYDLKTGAYHMGDMTTRLVGIYSAQNFESELGVVTRIETVYRSLAALEK